MILAIKVVVRKREVRQLRQPANASWNEPRHRVPRDIQQLDGRKALEALRQCTYERIRRHIQDRHVPKHPDLGRQTSSKAIVREDELIQCVGHLADASRNAPFQIIVGNDHDRGRGVSEIFRDRGREPVVVQEDRVEVLFKKLRRQFPLEIVVSDVEILQLRQGQNYFRKQPDEAVVA